MLQKSKSLSFTSMEPVLWLRISGDLLWMVMGSDRGTARSVSSLDRSSKLPGSVCFCPFWARKWGGRKKSARCSPSEQNAQPTVLPWYYLPRYLCRSWPEPKASRSILLLLHAFDTWAEVKLHMETFLWREVLWGEATKYFQMFLIRRYCTSPHIIKKGKETLLLSS